MSKKLEDMSNEEIDEKRFALMKKLCDTKGIEYPPSLVKYLNRKAQK